MSIEALNWAFDLKLKTGPSYVLVVLANYADESGNCYPSYARIHEITGISERSIGEHLAYLEARNIISRTRKRYADGTVGGYVFTLHTQISPVANIAGSPPANKRKTTREKPRQPHAKSAGHSNHHNNLKDNQKETAPENAVLTVFEQLWSDVNPKLLKSRQGAKQTALKRFERLARSHPAETLAGAIRAYYADAETKRDNFKYACGISTCLSKESFAGYLGKAQETDNDGMTAWDHFQLRKTQQGGQ